MNYFYASLYRLSHKCELRGPVVQVRCRSTSAGRCINPDLQHVSTPYLENVDQFLTDPDALARVPFPYGYDSLVVGHWSYIMMYDANAAYSTVPLVMRS
jgi:hypothetical protein